MCTSAVFLAGEEVSTGYRLRLYSILLMLRIPIYLKSWRKKILRSEAHDSVVYGWPRSLPEVRTVFQIHPIPCSRSFSPGPLDKQAPISTHKFSRLTSLNSGCIWLNNCVAECRRVPGMSRGFHFWQRQTDRQIDRVTGLWLVNPRLPAMSPRPMEPGTCHTDKMRRGGEKAQSDASKTDRACATTLTADTDSETARLVVNCLKFHSISCKTHILELVLNSKLILFSFIAMFWSLAQLEKYQNSFFDVFLLSSHQTAYSPSCSEAD